MAGYSACRKSSYPVKIYTFSSHYTLESKQFLNWALLKILLPVVQGSEKDAHDKAVERHKLREDYKKISKALALPLSTVQRSLWKLYGGAKRNLFW